MIHRAGRVYFYGFDKNRFLEKNKSPILPKKWKQSTYKDILFIYLFILLKVGKNLWR